ncbi:general transcription factor 3C polypeptide 2 [Galendromus occidentalis]|uniref:General transcription factor 3C polypeptide 2 n=1 Tax=Galendromus occidentalis TaxID=34638 RepID=A0AAJ6QQZ2_9ACAR|nr:general transcription factor 3C polypeptide 2 [Galendromus occidentalis]
MAERSVRKRSASRRYLDYQNLDDSEFADEFPSKSPASTSPTKKKRVLATKAKHPKKGAAMKIEKSDSRGSSDRENEIITKNKAKRKPAYSIDYIDELAGQEIRCSLCEDFMTTNPQEAKEHLRLRHYYIARMNSKLPLSIKELRSALLLASKDENVVFECRCGRTTRWRQTYGDHLLKCQQHGYDLLIDDSCSKEIQEDRANEPIVIEGKQKRKSAIKAATTFSQFVEDEIDPRAKHDDDKREPVAKSKGEDDDFKVSEGESSDPDEEYDHELDADDYEPAEKTKSQSTQKVLEPLFNEFQGKYRDPIPVPIPDEEKTRWKTALHKYGRIKCLECGVSYTTSLGMDYHYQRCNKVEYGYKCLKCGLCFTRSCHKLLFGHLSSCYEMTSRYFDVSGRGRAKVAKNHVLSKNDYTEFVRRHYLGSERQGQTVFPDWRYQTKMWPKKSQEDCEGYLSLMKTSPKLKIGGNEERILERFEVWHNPQSKHNTLYVGGAVWCIKWVPMFEECDIQYFMTVSHSKGEEPVLMRRTAASKSLSKGCLTLWSCDRGGDNIENCYTICHDWGFVPQIEFCPSRSSTENRLCLLAATSEAGFVRILALPRPAGSSDQLFYLNPDPVAILEPPDLSSGSCCLAWDPMRDHLNLLVGYANGSVDLFTLKQRTLLLTEDDAFEASKHVGDHGMSVTAVQWQMIEERRIVVSAALDPDVIVWDVDQGVILGKYSRSMSRDMKVLQFLPSIVVSFEESVAVNSCVVVFESGAYKRAETTVVLHTAATAYRLDINHWRHMLVTADSAGTVTMSWLTNSNKLHNFKSRNHHVVLYEVKQRLAPGVDTLTEEVAHSVGTLEFKDHAPSWDKPIQNGARLSAPSRLEYPLNAVLSVAFNPNWGTDHLVASGLRCGIVRLSKVKYKPL